MALLTAVTGREMVGRLTTDRGIIMTCRAVGTCQCVIEFSSRPDGRRMTVIATVTAGDMKFTFSWGS